AFLESGESSSDLVKTQFKKIDSLSLVKFLCQALESHKENVRKAAAQTLARLGPKAKDAILPLKSFVEIAKGEEGALGQFALAQIDPVSSGAGAFVALSKALRDEKGQVRFTAAEALSQLKIPKEGID